MSPSCALRALALIAVWPAASSTGEAECKGGEDSECSSAASFEESSLLQHRGRSQTAPQEEWNEVAKKIAAGAPKSVASATPGASYDSSKSGVAFEGGGFVAQADYMGVVAALLHELPAVTTGLKNYNIEQLFKRFGSVSGVSGGAWFASQLIYSTTFDGLIYASAAKPEETGKIFKTQYYQKVLNPFVNTSVQGAIKGLAECLYKALPLATIEEASRTSSEFSLLQAQAEDGQFSTDPNYLPWYIEMIGEAIILVQSGGITWYDLVANMLERGAGISPTQPLGGQSAKSWAHGKRYVQGVTAVTPSGNENAELVQLNITARSKAGTVLSYTVNQPEGVAPTYTPAKYSVIVNEDAQQDSPMPFCANKGCFGNIINYNYKGEITSRNLGDSYQMGFENKAGMLPIAGVAAASSAFEGKPAVEMGLGARQGCVELAVWTSAGVGDGKAFSAARQLRDKLATPFPVGQALAKQTIDEGLQPLLDGGVTEATGLGWLAADTDDILVFLNAGVGTMGIEAFLDAFQSAEYPSKVLFESPTRKQVQEAFEDGSNFTTMQANAPTRFLQNVTYGSIDCVTAPGPHFGIKQGRKIKVSFVSVTTANITLGLIEANFSYNSFYNYAVLTQEIVQTMTDSENAPKTRDLLKSLFL